MRKASLFDAAVQPGLHLPEYRGTGGDSVFVARDDWRVDAIPLPSSADLAERRRGSLQL